MGRLDGKKFARTYKVSVSEQKINAPVGSGYRKLQGILWYIPSSRRIKEFITGIKVVDNLGPIFTIYDSEVWSKSSSDFKAMRAHLAQVLKSTYVRIRDRDETLIPVAMQITRCNRAGMLDSEFMEKTCAKCVCWYCEITDG